MSNTQEEPCLMKDGKILLPKFKSYQVEISEGRKIIVFDSQNQTEGTKKLPSVFLHGFPDNVFTFRRIAPLIAKSKRRCILLSCPGYDTHSTNKKHNNRTTSWSVECVSKEYAIAIENIFSNQADFSYHLVGHDWGAMHASHIARHIHPRRVASLTMAAVPYGFVAGMKQYPKDQLIRNSWYMAYFQLPYFPESWMRRDGLAHLFKIWSPSYNVEADYLNSVRRTLLQPGVMTSAIDMYRQVMGKTFVIFFLIVRLMITLGYSQSQISTFLKKNSPVEKDEKDENNAVFNMPVLGITGNNDGCIDTRLFDVSMNSPDKRTFPRGCELLRVPNAGHFVFSEQPELTVKSLLATFETGDSLALEIKSIQIVKADYFVVGAGAMGLSFVDTLLTENKNATIILVDRYPAPGGHWTIAYPFVHLHQPASAYGVNSKRLGKTDTMDPTNLSSKDEICTYYNDVVADFLATGSVQYFPECEADIKTSTFTSLKNHEQYQVLADKIVDATYMKVTVPAMRPPPFPIQDPSIISSPVNEIPKLVSDNNDSDIEFVVAGGGKTGIDAVLELLRLGVPSSSIIWIIPNDSWIVLRENMVQPHLFMKKMANRIDLFLHSNNSQEVLLKLESAHKNELKNEVTRLDRNVMPTRFKAATISVTELSKIRSIERVVRLGRILLIKRGTIVLDNGSIQLKKKTFIIDCTANGAAPAKKVPVFSGNRIVLQSVYVFQTLFSAAIIAYVETKESDNKIKNEICVPCLNPNQVDDFGEGMYRTIKIQDALIKRGHFRFISGSRLNFVKGTPFWRVLWVTFGPSKMIEKKDKFVAKVESGGFKIPKEKNS